VSAKQKPEFITFTGVDDAAYCKGMIELSAKYPIEWGVLVDRDKKGVPLFPTNMHVDRIRKSGIRLCAHICGSLASDIAAGTGPDINLAGFARIQVNYSRSGATPLAIRAVSEFANKHAVRAALQCREDNFPLEETSVDWLYDVSFGEGIRPTSFPPIVSNHPFCGISGGLNSDNVLATLDEKLVVESAAKYWIDMESGVRTDGAFDLDLCARVCEQVYGSSSR
jgi:hypothetical protein